MPELPTVRTPDPQHIWKHRNWVKVCEVSELPTYVRTSDRRNYRRMSELPTVGTPDLCRNSRPSRHLKSSRWPLVIHTGHVRYDHHSEHSKLFKLQVVGTPNHCRNFRPSELPTCVGTPHEPTREQHFYSYWANTWHVRYASSMHTGHMARPAISQLALLSLKHSNLTWVGLSTYETLSINMMHPS